MNGKVAMMQGRLIEVIKKWIEEEAESGDFPCYVSDDLAHIMAKAAICVLEGAVDLEDFLRVEGMLDE